MEGIEGRRCGLHMGRRAVGEEGREGTPGGGAMCSFIPLCPYLFPLIFRSRSLSSRVVICPVCCLPARREVLFALCWLAGWLE